MQGLNATWSQPCKRYARPWRQDRRAVDEILRFLKQTTAAELAPAGCQSPCGAVRKSETRDDTESLLY
jgi:hypothetical protein